MTKKMTVFLTGATGLVGRALALRLRRDGHEVIAWVRDVDAARQVLGHDVTLVPTTDTGDALPRALGRSDAVVNLAGAPVAKRWTAAHRRALVHSRVDLTHRLVHAMEGLDRRPAVLVSASAVGYYGDRGDEDLPEEAEPGEGFLAELCVAWEAAAHEAESLGVRVVTPRLGVVLDAEGGALAKMRPAFAWGLGGVIGSGRQRMPFIHLRDLVELVITAIDDERWHGPINAVAPEPVTNRSFTRALAQALGRPAWMRVPALALRLAMGDAAQVLLHSQGAVPRRLQALGFRFRHGALADALREIVSRGRGAVEIGPAREIPEGDYLARRKPRYLLEHHTLLDAPVSEVFAFFREAENLGAITPPGLSFEIRSPTPIDMHEGQQIAYRIRLGPLPMRWQSRIDAWEPRRRFVDVQLRGPYRAWYHEHRFEPEGDRTRMTDRIWYAPPLGPLGWIAQRWFVAPMLRRIFGHRQRAVDLRFGVVDDPRPSGS